MSQDNLRTAYGAAAPYNYVVEGGAREFSTGLTVNFSPVKAWINGVYIDTSLEPVTVPDDATSYIFLKQDGTLVANQTGLNPGNALLLWVVFASGGSAATGSIDLRVRRQGLLAVSTYWPYTVNNDSILTQTEMRLWVEENSVYFVECFARIEATVATGFKYGFVQPPGITGPYFSAVLATSYGAGAMGITVDAVTSFYPLMESDTWVSIYGRMETGATPGIFSFAFCQATSSDDPVQVKQGHMRLTKLAV